jgi:hypothetical protein
MAQSVAEEHKPPVKADAFDLSKEIADLDSVGRLTLNEAPTPGLAAPLSVKPPVGAPPITLPNPNPRDSKGKGFLLLRVC